MNARNDMQLNKLVNAYWMYCSNIPHPLLFTLFLCSRFGVLYLREHHSRIENLRSLTELPLSRKCLDTGVDLLSFGFFTERMCS